MYKVVQSEVIGTPGENYPIKRFESEEEALIYAQENAMDYYYGLEVIEE